MARRRLGELLPDDALVVADMGHAGMWTAAHLDLAAGQGFIRAAGSLGWGLPGDGARSAAPMDRVVLFTGDGGSLYHLSELETAARWKVPLIVVVNDNHSLNQEITLHRRLRAGSPVATTNCGTSPTSTSRASPNRLG